MSQLSRSLDAIDPDRSFIGRRREGVTAAIGFAAVMLAYLATMMPGPAFMDTGEFQTVTYVLGVAHPTGYPLYTILGKLFGTLVPIGSWAYRMNLLSALCAAGAAVMLATFGHRSGVSSVVAFAAALGFAFALNTWRAAGRADPYTLTAMIGAALWLMAIKWKDTGERRWLWRIATVAGLGLGSAGVLSMELPAIVLFLAITQPRKFFAPFTMIVAALLGIAGLVSIYLYLPLRAAMHPPLNYGNSYTWQGFQFVALGGQVGGIINYATLEGVRMFVRRLPEAVEWYREWLTPTGLALASPLALIGVAVLAIRDWRLALCVMIGFVAPIYPTLTVPINDTAHYLLISNWLLLFAVSVAIQTIVVAPIVRLTRGAMRTSLSLVARAAIISLPLFLAHANWSAANNRDYHDGEILARGVLNVVAPRGVVFCWWGPSNALWYAHYVEHMRPDVDIYDDSTTLDLGWGGVIPAIGRFYPGRPVYSLPIGDELDVIEKHYKMRTVADLHAFGQTLYQVIGSKAAEPRPTIRVKGN